MKENLLIVGNKISELSLLVIMELRVEGGQGVQVGLRSRREFSHEDKSSVWESPTIYILSRATPPKEYIHMESL